MKKRHVVLGLLGLLSVITYFDRVCISVAGPRMQNELGITADRWGWVLSAFILSYGLFEIPSGAWGDRWGQRKTLTRIVLWWSVFTSLTGLAKNLWLLLVARFLFGAGEAGAFPNISGCIGRWFPAAERARAQGVVWGASRIGGALSPWIVVPLMTWIGWRSAFFIFGVLGLIWAAVWFAWYRDRPTEQPGIRKEELREIAPDTSVAPVPVPWGKLFRHRQLWLIMTMFSCYVWGSIFYLTWFPTYLVKGRGLSEAQMGWFAALPFLLSAVGNLAGGFLCDRLSLRYGLSRGRRLVGTTSLAVSALLLFAVTMTHSQIAAVILLGAGFGVMDCMLPVAWTLCVDFGGRHAGAVAGAMNTAGQIGGFLCTLMFGYMVKAFGNYDLPLLVIAAFVLTSACLFSRIDVSANEVNLDGHAVPDSACA